MDKETLRGQLKFMRLSLSPIHLAQSSSAILERLIESIDWANVKTLHCFMPILTLYEVDTRQLFEYIWIAYPKVITYTTAQKDDAWLVHLLKPHFELKDNVETPQFDVIIVPMLGFDASFHRIGYGGGYYDRFLSTQPQAQKVGVCFEIGHLQQLPIEPHDIPLDTIITDQQIYQ